MCWKQTLPLWSPFLLSLSLVFWFFSLMKEYSVLGLYIFRKCCQTNTESSDGPQSKTASLGKMLHWLKHWKKSRIYSFWWQMKCKKYFRIRRCCKQYSFHNTNIKNPNQQQSHTHQILSFFFSLGFYNKQVIFEKFSILEMLQTQKPFSFRVHKFAVMI